ncbi:MAG: WbuC family cupin fold metalloprotein [bacterium]|nr:WbuC family cupin fold metalloprotein [bacterium]
MIKVIDRKLLEKTSEKAAASPRLRMNHNFHELSDGVQRMLNAIEPGSYTRLHRHLDPDKMELFILLKGKGAVITFDDDGLPLACFKLEAGGETLGLEVPPGVWHTVVSTEVGTVFLEVKDGPYLPSTDKDFASWAPLPDTPEAERYMAGLFRELDRQEALALRGGNKR